MKKPNKMKIPNEWIYKILGIVFAILFIYGLLKGIFGA